MNLDEIEFVHTPLTTRQAMDLCIVKDPATGTVETATAMLRMIESRATIRFPIRDLLDSPYEEVTHLYEVMLQSLLEDAAPKPPPDLDAVAIPSGILDWKDANAHER